VLKNSVRIMIVTLILLGVVHLLCNCNAHIFPSIALIKYIHNSASSTNLTWYQTYSKYFSFNASAVGRTHITWGHHPPCQCQFHPYQTCRVVSTKPLTLITDDNPSPSSISHLLNLVDLCSELNLICIEPKFSSSRSHPQLTQLAAW